MYILKHAPYLDIQIDAFVFSDICVTMQMDLAKAYSIYMQYWILNYLITVLSFKFRLIICKEAMESLLWVFWRNITVLIDFVTCLRCWLTTKRILTSELGTDCWRSTEICSVVIGNRVPEFFLPRPDRQIARRKRPRILRMTAQNVWAILAAKDMMSNKR